MDEIVVHPYTEQTWPEETLLHLYQFMQESPPASVFWRDGTPLPLVRFIQWLAEPGKMLFIPMVKDPDLGWDAIIGFCLVDEIDAQLHRAAVHFWVRKKWWWKRRPQRAAAMILQLLFTETPLQVLVCRLNSANRLGLKFMQQIGMHIAGEIPDWYKHGETYYPATMGYIHRNEVNHGAF